LQKGLDRNEVQAELRKRFPSNAEVSEVGEVDTVPSTTTTLPALLNHFAEVQNNLVEILKQQAEINRKLEQRIEQLEDRKGVWERLLDRIFGKGD